MIEITETDALSRVAAYCSTAEHCRAEVTEKLQRWGIPYDAIDRIINRLEQEKYIDEERFAVPSFMISTASPMGEDKDRAGASTEENSPKCILPLPE